MQQSIQSNSSTVKIGSQHYINQIEGIIIQIARSLAVEHNLPVSPDTKQMTHEILQRKINQLLSDKDVEGLKKVWDETVKVLKNQGEMDSRLYAQHVYEALKIAGFDNV